MPFKAGDILFAPANIAPLFVPKSRKLVITIHDVAFLTYPQSFSKFFRFYYRWLMPKVIKRADRIITISEASKKEIIKYYPQASEKIGVVYLGLDARYTVKKDIEKEKIILYVGSLNERKNFSAVIRAFELLERDDYRLFIVGNFSGNFSISEQNRKLLERAKKNPMIEFKSDVNDSKLIRFYNQAKIFLFPSFYEGFGLPPLEAMACGTPVIVSYLSSMPEVCGDAALYADPYDINDISKKMQMLLEDKLLQKEMAERGLEYVKRFTWEKAAKKHMEVFEKVSKYRVRQNGQRDNRQQY